MDTISVLRAMAWQRAKGELRALLETYNEFDDSDPDDKCGTAAEEVERFIKYIDMKGTFE